MHTSPRSWLRPLFGSLVLALGVSPLRAVIIEVEGQVVVTSDYGTEFKTGDVFAYRFAFDDTATDTTPETFSANFNNAVTLFTFERNPANQGSWDPATGVFAVGPVLNFNVGANSESITLQFSGTGFQSVDGQPFFDVGLTYNWGGTGRNFVDTGAGQTFAQMVGESGLNFATAGSFFAELRNTNFESVPLSHSVTVVPEPATAAALLGMAVLGVAALRRRRE